MLPSREALLSDRPPLLNPRLDRAVLRDEYRQSGRIHIRDVLTQASAERIHHCLRDETPYDLCLNARGEARALSSLTPQQRLECATAVWREVGIAGFQFLFDMHLLSWHS
jgi:hypothetical protein